jgi:hypothetical protein
MTDHQEYNFGNPLCQVPGSWGLMKGAEDRSMDDIEHVIWEEMADM